MSQYANHKLRDSGLTSSIVSPPSTAGLRIVISTTGVSQNKDNKQQQNQQQKYTFLRNSKLRGW